MGRQLLDVVTLPLMQSKDPSQMATTKTTADTNPDNVQRVIAIDAGLAAYQAQNEALTQQREAVRAASPMIDVIAITGFTIISDPHGLESRVVEPGETLSMSAFDVELNVGRVQPVSLVVRA